MMWFLSLLSWVASLLQLLFATVCIATCLYYMSELVEEHTAIASKAIHWTVYFVAAVHACIMLFENIPTSLSLVNLTGLGSTLLLVRTFPYFRLVSFSFLLTCLSVVAGHYLALKHFHSTLYPYSQVMAYLTVCLWLVPLELLVSLTVNENVLPTLSQRSRQLSNDDDLVSNYFSRKEKGHSIRRLFIYAKECLLPERSKKGF